MLPRYYDNDEAVLMRDCDRFYEAYSQSSIIDGYDTVSENIDELSFEGIDFGKLCTKATDYYSSLERPDLKKLCMELRWND